MNEILYTNKNKVTYEVSFLVIVFIIFYLDLALFHVPMALSFFVLLLVGTIDLLRKLFGLLLFLWAIGVLTNLVSEANPPIFSVISSSLQFSLSICVFFAVYRKVSYFNQKSILIFSLSALLVFILLGVLERLGALSAISSKFGQMFYSSDVGYSFYLSEFSNERDIGLVGFSRPTIFSPEPSIAAIGISVLLIIASSFVRNRFHLLYIVILFVMSYKIIGSPIPLIAMLVVLLLFVRRIKSLLLKALLATFFVFFGGFIVNLFLSSRLDVLKDINNVADSSEGIRLILPFMNVWGAWSDGSVLGVGPGAIYDYNYIASLNMFGSSQFGTSALALMLFYYGPIFSFLIVWFFARLLNYPKKLWLHATLSVFFLGITLGTFEVTRFMGFLAIMLAAFSKVNQRTQT